MGAGYRDARSRSQSRLTSFLTFAPDSLSDNSRPHSDHLKEPNQFPSSQPLSEIN